MFHKTGTAGERSSLISRNSRTQSPAPDGLGLSWSGITYDVKKKNSPPTAMEPGLGQASNGAWEDCTVQQVHGDGSVEVQWKRDGTSGHLTPEQIKSTGKKRILKGVTGNINSGRLCCIMGPSGAGKSSLLNLLAGRVADGVNGVGVSGTVMLDGKPLNPIEFRNKVAYVMQEDALFATQTPLEALNFSAKLRNPSLNAEARESLVRDTLHKLRLDKCANTFTGSVMIPGLSGGEKKRTAIGIELVANPQYLFLDEPTSGLDSYAAWMVCDMLKQLANGQYDGVKRTVVATIHQPSSEVFALFDDVVLVSQGRNVYNGPVAGLTEHFAGAGYPIESGYNPADHVMFCMQLEDEVLHRPQGDAEEGLTNDRPKPTMLLADYWNTVSARFAVTPTHAPLTVPSGDVELAREAKSSFLTQFIALGLREAVHVGRDKTALIARFGTTIFINLLVGLVFSNAGSPSKGYLDAEGIQSHFGALAQIAIGGMFGLAQPMMLSFPLEKPVFLREYATGTYSALPYFWSKLMVEIPMSIAQSLVLYFVTYWLMDLQGPMPYLVLATALLGLVSASTALLIGSIASNPQIAIQLSPLLFVPQILFAGIFIPTSSIPSFLRWAQYLCSLKYGLNLITIAEFSSVPFSSNTTEHAEAVFSRDALFDSMDIKKDWEWAYFGIMIGVFVLFRVMAFIILARKGSRLQA